MRSSHCCTLFCLHINDLMHIYTLKGGACERCERYVWGPSISSGLQVTSWLNLFPVIPFERVHSL